MKTKKWLGLYCLAFLPLLLCIAVLTIFIDPFFHYHKPNTNLFFYELTIKNERYLNDGIIKNFDYDAIITGSSMSENFKSSEFNKLFNCNSIKVPFSGATFYEITSNIEKGFSNHNIKYVIRSLDSHVINWDSKEKRSHFIYPEYLYNDTKVDDVKYFWNTSVLMLLLKNCSRQLMGLPRGITSFDEYANWMKEYRFAKSEVLKNRNNFKKTESISEFTTNDDKRVRENVQNNIVNLALKNPETLFYYFFPPHSIATWGELYENGELAKRLEEEAIAAKMLVQCENIHLFSFNSRKDWILNLDRYKDTGHYDEQINSEMLRLMKEEEDKYRITKNNVEDYIKSEEDFFMNFDYNSIF